MVKAYGSRLYVRNKRHRNTSFWSWKLIFINRVPCQVTTEIVLLTTSSIYSCQHTNQIMYKLKKLEVNENISYRRKLNIINISAVKK